MGCIFSSMYDSFIEKRPQRSSPQRRFSWSGSNEHTPIPSGDFDWLPKHKRPIKNKEAPIWWDNKCTICEEVFENPRTKDRHMRKVHYNTPRIKCPECQLTFGRRQHMTRHVETMHKKSRTTFECDICEKQFLYEGNLTRHRKNVHGGQRDFKCEECPAKFTRREDLRNHVREGKHYQEEYCKYCKQTLIFKSCRKKDFHYLRRGKSYEIYSCQNVQYGKESYCKSVKY